MKFSQEYRNEMDNITVPEAAVNKVYTYLNSAAGISRRSYGTKFFRSAITFACLAILLIAGFCNRYTISAFAEGIFSQFIFNIDGKRIEMGEVHPVEFNMDTFLLSPSVNLLKDDENNSSYWKNYNSLEELENETGITIISSALLESASDQDSYNIHILPAYYSGHLNVDFIYGEYHVNVDGMFALEGFNQELWGYGTAEGEKYNSVYEATNGIRAYFVKTKHGNKTVFMAGDILYQVNSNAPTKEIKKLIESLKY